MLKKIRSSLLRLNDSHPVFVKLSVLVLLLSFYLKAEPGFFNLTHFSFDQGEDIILTKQLVVDHKLSLISRGSGLEGVFMGPGYTWFLAIPFLVSQGNPSFNVIYFAFLSTLTAVATYFLVKPMSDHTTASLAALFSCLAPSFVGSAKIVLSPTPIIFSAIIYLWFIYQIVYFHRHQYLPLLFFLISIWFHFEIAFALFAFTSAVTLLIPTHIKHFKPRTIASAIILFLIPFGPQLFFDLRHNFLISQSLIKFFSGNNQSLGSSGLSLYERFLSRLSSLYQDLSSSIAFFPHSTVAVTISFFILILGWFFIIHRRNQTLLRLGTLTLSLIGLMYLGFVVYPGPLWPWYRVGMPVFFTLLYALSISQLFQLKARPVNLFLGLYLLIIFTLGIDLQGRINSLSNKYPGDISTLQNQQKVLDDIYLHAKSRPFALYIYTPPVYPNIWDYQLYHHSFPKYGYLPSPYDVMPQAHNPELIYLLIETNVEFPIWIEGWRDNFTHYGAMIESWDYAFGARVEQWQFTSQPQNTTPLIREVNVFAHLQ